MTGAREEILERILYIHYLVQFKRDTTRVQALINSRSEVNAIHPIFAKQLSLPVQPIDVWVQKIDGITLDTDEMVIAAFFVVDKANRVRFFEETFLMANISPERVFGMPYLTLSNANVDFLGWELRWRTYTTKKALPTTRRVELVGKKEFVTAMLDPEYKTFVVHVASFRSTLLNARPQISGLIAKEALIKVSAKYSNFVDVFSPDLTFKLPKHTGINDYAIKLVNG